jgi:hypothetical protein
MGGTPNSVCLEKIPEGEPVEYRFNSSGYRADTNFGPKSPDTYRIVVIGSSFSVGARIPIEKAFATQLPPELSRLTGKKVEILNEGMAGNAAYPPIVSLRFKDALAAQPDLILWALTPWDVQNVENTGPGGDKGTGPREQESQPVGFVSKVLSKWGPDAIVARHFQETALMLRHMLYESQSLYVRSFLMKGDSIYDVRFLKAEPSEEWNHQLLEFDSYDEGIEERVKAAGVPLVVVLLPLRSQAAMISMGEWPAEFDPFKLGNELDSIVTRHGGIYLDILPDFRAIPNPEQGYFPVEGHLNPRGHAMISSLLARSLTSGAVPALSVSAQQPVDQAGRK